MPSTDPRLAAGTLWRLSPASAAPGAIVALASWTAERRGLRVALATAHSGPANPGLGEITVGPGDYRPNGDVAVAVTALQGFHLGVVQPEQLEEAVGLLSRRVTTELRAAAERTSWAGVLRRMGEPAVDGPTVAPTERWLADMRVIQALEGVHHREQASSRTGPKAQGVVERTIAHLRERIVLELPATPTLVPIRSRDGGPAMAFDEACAVTTDPQDPGSTQLTVRFGQLDLPRDEPLEVRLLSSDDVLASVTIEEPQGAQRRRLRVAPRVAAATTNRLLFLAAAPCGDEGDPATRAPRFYWPPWERKEGPLPLARYVAPRTLAGRELGVGAAGDLLEPAEVVAHAARLYEALAAKRLRYTYEPYLPPYEGRQQVRHAAWLLRDRLATCLDVAVLYAAMCLEAGMRPLLATSSSHAWVLLRGDDEPVPGTVGEGPLLVVTDPERLRATATVVAVDCVGVTQPARSFAEARERGSALLDEGIELVDVEAAQRGGYGALDEPDGHTIRLFDPGVDVQPTPFAAQRALADALERARGRHVLWAPSGRGKSTLARAIARRQPQGAAWFLAAADERTLLGSLAEAELAERGDAPAALAADDRYGFAQAALARLRDSIDPWLVVVDNADGLPDDLDHLLPEPDPERGQLLLITTTERSWLDEPGVVAHELGGLEPHETPGGIPTRLALGRPLIVRAFEALRAVAPEAATVAIAGATEGEGEGVAPAAHWVGVRLAFADEEAALTRLAAVSALLPADRQPMDLVERASAAPAGLLDRVARTGLVTVDASRRRVTLHRLFGGAIRDDLEQRDCEALDAAAKAILTDAGAVAYLGESADLDAGQALAARARALHDRDETPDAGLGCALHAAATILEPLGQVAPSAELFRLAQHHLVTVPERWRELCDCLLGRARVVNQQMAGNQTELRRAVDWVREAYDHYARAGRAAEAGRFVAMRGLLEQKLAKWPGEGETRLTLLEAARDVIEEADEMRSGLPTTHPERARSAFNRAGVRIQLAKEDPVNAAAYLSAVEGIYTAVWEQRRRLYGVDVHPHIAACIHGLGIVGYCRATLLAATDRRRLAWLREASSYAAQALDQRTVFSGPAESIDVGKSVELLTKALAARTIERTGDLTAFRGALDTAEGELSAARARALDQD
jgi:hypothetical protein